MKEVKIDIAIEKETKDKLIELSKLSDITLSHYIRRIIKEHLKNVNP